MGQFSWIYSDTNKQVIDDKEADTFLLIPKAFQHKYGKSIYEGCYEGYGEFGGHDVYDLVLEWNKDMIPKIIRRIKNDTWRCTTSENDIANLQNYFDEKEITCEARWLGIIMACYDEDNMALEYPIKITSKEMDYEDVVPSKSDPNQGWEVEDDDEDDYY